MSSTAESQRLMELSINLASLLLLRHGELALSDIRAIPFVTSDEMAAAIAAKLAGTFDVDIELRNLSNSGVAAWEDFLILKGPGLAEGSIAAEVA